MPNIFKRFMKPEASAYVFPDASNWDDVTEIVKPGDGDEEPFEEFQPDEAELTAGQDGDFTGFHEYNGLGGEALPEEPEPPPAEAAKEESLAEPAASAEEAEPPRKRRSTPVDYARIQAEAILSQAREEADAMKEAALVQAQEEIQQLRREARSDGYNAGYAEGMASGMSEGREERERQAMEQGKIVKEFLESAVKQRDQLLDETREELRDLALAIAEKVIRISLKSSGDVLMRMIETATEKHRRCEWVQIYIADCDAKNLAMSMPELTAALGHLSDRVRIIPMADDESGTCIIEMPDEIIDASVSTQMDNIRELMSTAVRD
ncbi:MAG: F0F1 ATP synthase subunit delta [Clostridiaceae bacterium]|nr:F0F1 ATP synthase subunit delta [Clostridiaceae bacterium]